MRTNRIKPILIIKTGTAPAEVAARRGDFEQWIAQRLGRPHEALSVVRVDLDQALPDPHAVRGVVVTGSAAMVSHREPWSERTGAWLAETVPLGVPVLGICYGHQLLADAIGGRAGPNPNGRQIGTVAAQLTAAAADDPLLNGLPSPLHVQTTHVESVLALPKGARLLATTELDPYHAFAIGPRCWGVQFHPEFDADVMRGYIATRREALAQEGRDPDALGKAVFDTPHGETILHRFAQICGEI